MLRQLMEQFAQEFDELPKDGSGNYLMELEDGLIVVLKDTNPGISFFCEIGPVPATDLEQFYSLLMIGNVYGEGTGGAVLGLNDEGTLIVLNYDVDYTLDYREFLAIFEDFCAAAEAWSEEAKNTV